ncbi:beta-1,3-glucanase family protein [Fulvivirga ligni]|uniref:beta-1,3-glucanase family protein n=1 Tax=Fulvivirga ligni TaxID=2904246 RepID=UPI001F48D874|nr:beta-1,3-glucanase family protein [Fulvivirga ligni]UII19966.1 beta-1,3-glucanase family protein [Fulvivirga ligni]
MKSNVYKPTIRALKALVFGLLLLFGNAAIAQTLPYQITNNSPYSDSEVYIGIVGITDGHVWVDPTNGQVHPMSPSYNNVPGPVYGGNQGPGNNGLYANCFRKLSDIPNRTINIPKIAGCRIMISFQSQLYLYFFGHSGAPSGYSAPNLENPTDPNQGIKYELVELTYNDYGLWCNTTRVDNYQYPMGLEVWGNGFYKKVGELKSHQQILSEWQATAPSEFQGLLKSSEGIIQFPTKNPSFPTNFFQGYIDAIWSKYSGQQLVFNSGQAGVWRGSVQGGNQFVFTRDGDGQVATIPGKPTTKEAMEGSGVLASGGQWDKVVQAQFVAAITRHAIDLNVASGVLQDFGNTSKYYQTWPYNWYSKFFHRTDISQDGQTYTFAYDDVFDQSATIHTASPTSIKISVGGLPGGNNGNPGVSGLAGTYTLKNRRSGLNMDVAQNGNSANGTNILQWTPTGNPNQQFKLTEVSTGVYSVICVKTNKCIDIDGVSTADFANLHQWDYVGGANQHFKIEDAGGGYYKLRATHSNKIIEVGYASLDAGANINQYTDNGQLCGQWQLVPVGGSSWSTTIQAEDYAVMSGVQLENCSEGGQNVGYIDVDDWMVYDVNLPSNGTYTVSYRVASQNGGGNIQLENAGASPVYGTIGVPSTGGWQNWTTISHSVNLNAGAQQIAIKALAGGFNINWLKISRQAGAANARTSMDDIAVDEDNILYPNPAENTIRLRLAEEFNGGQISIMDKTGKTVYSATYTGQEINISQLPADMYILRLNAGSEQIIKKFIKK